MTPARAHVLAQRAGLCDQRKAFSVAKHARTHARMPCLASFANTMMMSRPPAGSDPRLGDDVLLLLLGAPIRM